MTKNDLEKIKEFLHCDEYEILESEKHNFNKKVNFYEYIEDDDGFHEGYGRATLKSKMTIATLYFYETPSIKE